MSGSDANYGGNRDIKKLLGNPKITFVLGKSEESDIVQVDQPQGREPSVLSWWKSLDILTFRLEISCELKKTRFVSSPLGVSVIILQGTKDGERIRKIMNDGGLVPFELTVQILINGLIANPSKVLLYNN